MARQLLSTILQKLGQIKSNFEKMQSINSENQGEYILVIISIYICSLLIKLDIFDLSLNMIKINLKRFLIAGIASFSLKHNFSTLPNKALVPTSNLLYSDKALQSRGVIAYYFMQFIKQYQFVNYLSTKQSLRYQLLSEEFFYEYMLRNIKSLNQQVKNLEDLYAILPIQSYRQVASAFKIGQGAPINIQIFCQQRTINVRNKKNRVALNPTYITTLYFNFLSKGTNHIISGEKGTGKSFSFVVFNYLSSIFLDYHQNLVKKQLMPTKNIQFQIAQFIPKICYVTMEDNLDPQHYFKQILLQYETILGKKQYQKQKKLFYTKSVTLNDLFALLKKISQCCREKNIKNTIVIDEANRIFKVITTLHNLKNEDYNLASLKGKNQIIPKRQNWKNSSAFKSLQFYNKLIQLFVAGAATQFDNIIFNSSQDFELDNIEQIFKEILQDFWMLKFFGRKLRILDGKNKIEYNQFMQLPQGQIQLYNSLWFQIERFIQLKDVGKQISVPIEELTAKYRAAFQEAFGLSKLDAVQLLKTDSIPSNFQIWRSEVRHFHIRQYFIEIKNKQQNIRKKRKQLKVRFSRFELNPTVAQLDTFKKEVIQVKKSIQSFRKKCLMKNLKQYLVNGVEQRETQQRRKFIDCLQSEIRKTPQTPNETYSNYECKIIPSHKRDEFIERIGFGYNNTTDQTLRFSIDRQSFIDIFNELKNTKEYAYINMDHFLYLLLSRRPVDNKLYEDMLNNFLSFLFESQRQLQINLRYRQQLSNTQLTIWSKTIIGKQRIRGFTTILTDEEYQAWVQLQKQRENYQPPNPSSIDNPQPVIYSKKTQTYHPISHSQLKQQFNQLILIANKYSFAQNECIALSPMLYLTEDREKLIPCDNQTFYDNMFVRKQQNLELIFIDWTFGKLQTKGLSDKDSEKYQKIKDFLLKLKNIIQYEGKVQCTMIIAAPQYKLSEYYANDHIQGDWHISIRAASFDEDLSFNIKDDTLQKMNSIFKRIYESSKSVEEKELEFQKQRKQRNKK